MKPALEALSSMVRPDALCLLRKCNSTAGEAFGLDFTSPPGQTLCTEVDLGGGGKGAQTTCSASDRLRQVEPLQPRVWIHWSRGHSDVWRQNCLRSSTRARGVITACIQWILNGLSLAVQVFTPPQAPFHDKHSTYRCLHLFKPHFMTNKSRTGVYTCLSSIL